MLILLHVGISSVRPLSATSVRSRYNGLSMIAHLRGNLLAKHPNQAIVETAGVGYDVTISVPTFSDLPAVGAEVALTSHACARRPDRALRISARRRKNCCSRS